MSFSCFSLSSSLISSFSSVIPFAMTGAGLACSDFGWDLGEDMVGLLSIAPFSFIEVT